MTAVVLALTLITAVPVAGAPFVDQVSASLSVSTLTLPPPTAPNTEAGICTEAGDAISVTWTPSSSPQVTGYEILRSTTTGGPYSSAAIVTGQATASYTDSPLSFSTTYYYVVQSVRGNWRSVSTPEVFGTTRSSNCT